MDKKETFQTESWDNYELLDAGGGKKLERFGEFILIRPELQAYFKSEWPFTEWNKLAHAEFIEKTPKKGIWKILKTEITDSWLLQVDDLCCKLELTSFKHVGIFPEQYGNWKFIQQHLPENGSFLNVFAYTGMASVAAKSVTGSVVTHVDSMRQLVTWANENQELSKLDGIKWVVDDALKFALREVKRGNTYDGIIMDPPAFGLGTKGEKWILEEQLPILIETAAKLLSRNGFLIINTYSPKIDLGFIRRQVNYHFRSAKKVELDELWATTKTGKRLFYGNLLRIQK